MVSKKKPPKQSLTTADKKRNSETAANRIIVENWFGRLAGLWRIFLSSITGMRNSMKTFLQSAPLLLMSILDIMLSVMTTLICRPTQEKSSTPLE